MTGSELYQAGQLDEAIEAMNAEVRANPADLDRRGFLCELLCIAGNLERAENLLVAMEKQSAELAAGLALFRQLVRAEQWRQQFFVEGSVPEFVVKPALHLERQLEASIYVREGRLDEAARVLAVAEENRPSVAGSCDGTEFEDFRDLDDLVGGAFEVLTSTGKYYWIGAEDVESLVLRQPERPRDLLWRPTEMNVRGGPDGVVYLPAIYHGQDLPAEVRLGRVSDWRGEEGEPMRGVGLRTWLIGEEARTILEFERIEFAARD